MSKRPDIFYVDDDPQELLGIAGENERRFAAHEPQQLKSAAKKASRANLWVFDYFTNEDERKSLSLDGTARNGLALFHQFRRLIGESRPPTVVVSNHLDAALGVVDMKTRHIAAEQLGVEWLSPKDDVSHTPLREIVSIADAVYAVRKAHSRISAVHPDKYVALLGSSILLIPRRCTWRGSAVLDISNWRPPVSPPVDPVPQGGSLIGAVYPQLRMGRELVSWMIRQVLPYASFLIRDPHIAVRLGITLPCLRSALKRKTKLRALLVEAQYEGILFDFLGSRWWSAAIDSVAWSLPREAAARKARLADLVAPVSLKQLKILDPVVISNPDLVETDEIGPVAECVRATDEYFPANAAPAWVKIEDAQRNSLLAKKVKVEDQAALVH